ncbi:hypothetical protein [Hydrogenophaga crocea]|uniref:Lipoprotein n=1 Tax=Hydrogenophaga crocea TaxID=2716225 RepID=A0A6G8IEQ8_9BURK|nr:hypothetical protein [Hydrogenophaga crocea]QIM51599.1 hypothetical protein G9Q37_05325 [Hydrogenophaga crocea]
MKLYALVLAAVLAGCASQPKTVWVKAGSTEDEFMRDRGQCMQATFSVPLATKMQQMMVYASCMQGKGWREVPVA